MPCGRGWWTRTAEGRRAGAGRARGRGRLSEAGPRTDSRWEPGDGARTVVVMPRTAIITGASRGLGLALARALADRGWRLVVDARGADALEVARRDLAERTDVVAIAGDVADAWHRAALIDAARGRIDALVNNASVLGPSTPALLTRSSIGPGAAATSAPRCHSSPTSPASATTSVSSASSRRARSSASAPRASITSDQPRRASSRASARPSAIGDWS